MKQTTFASAAWANKGKVTRRERFLADMDAGLGRQPHPLETMLRIHCLQHFFNLSDPGAEEALQTRSRCAVT
jgi:IS5 family transposase